MKKALSFGIFGIALLFAIVFAVSPVLAQTASQSTTATISSSDEASLIAQLEAILLQLIEALKARGFVVDANGNLTRATPTNPEQPVDDNGYLPDRPTDNGGAFCYNWTRNLTVGDRGADVDALVTVLVKEGFLPHPESAHIIGEDFTEEVASAVIGLQAKYGIRQTGVVGPMTRAKLNALYLCQTSFLHIQTPVEGQLVSVGGPLHIEWDDNLTPVADYYYVGIGNRSVGVTTYAGAYGLGFVYKKSHDITISQAMMDNFRANGVTDNRFHVVVEAYKDAGTVNMSDNILITKATSGEFSVVTGPVSSSVTVLSPNGSEWRVGETRQITWQTTGISSPNDKMTIYIVPTGDMSKNYNLISDIPNTGSYNYVVDDPSKFVARSPLYQVGGQFKIFVCARLATSSDFCSNGIGYSNPFTIVASSTQSTYSLSVALDPITPIGNVSAGSLNTPLFAFKFLNNGVNTLNLNGVAVSIPGVNQSTVSNPKLFDGNTNTFIANGVYNGAYEFTFPISLPAYTSKTFMLRGDISASATGSITPALTGIFHNYGTTLSLSGLGFSGNTLTIATPTTPPVPVGNPVISSVTAEVSDGGTLVIQGSNFSPTENYVQISNTPVGPLQFGPVTSTQNGTVITIVPKNMTTQTLSAGAHSVQVIRNPGYYISNTVNTTFVSSPATNPTTYPMIFSVRNKSTSQPISGMPISVGSSISSLKYNSESQAYYIDPVVYTQTTDASGRATFTLPALTGDSYSFVVGNTSVPIITAGQGGYSGTFTIPSAQSVFDVEVLIPTSTPVPVQPSLSATLSQVYEDRAGVWGVFGPGPGNPVGSSRGNVNDFVWNASLILGAEKTIKSIEINHNVGGEYWSTSNTGAYPLVVYVDGTKKNNDYGQSLGTYGAGTTNLVIYGQHENPYFTGGTITINFEDNSTPATANIPSSSFSPQVPAQTASALDAMSDILKRMLKQVR